MDRARDWTELILLVDPDNVNALYNTACAMAKAGETDLALEILTQVTPKAGLEGILWMRRDTDLDGLRGDSRFEKIMADAERRISSEGAEAKPVIS
jgi:adenylate cyclase